LITQQPVDAGSSHLPHRWSSLVHVLVVVALVEACRAPASAVALVVVGVVVTTENRRSRAALVGWILLSCYCLLKVASRPGQWASALVVSLELGAVVGSFLLGGSMRRSLSVGLLRPLGVILLLGGALVALGAPQHGFLINRLLMIGALMLISGASSGFGARQLTLAVVVALLQFLQGSRASAVLILGVTAWLWVKSLLARGAAGRLFASVVAASIAATMVAAVLGLEPLRVRVFSRGDVSRGLYFADRNKFLVDAVRQAAHSTRTVLVGIDPGTFRHVDALGLVYEYPHNVLLQLFLDFGFVVGLGVTILVVGLGAGALRNILQQNPVARTCAVVAAALGLLNMFNGSYVDVRFSALWLGAALAGERWQRNASPVPASSGELHG
jgi:hypothetical protein